MQQQTSMKWTILNFLRRHGWEVRRFDPFATLEGYLRYVLFPYLGVNCVLDVGAREGEYGQALRNVGYRGHIVSFEPVSASFERLRDRAARDSRWTVHNIALGTEDGRAQINVMRGSDFSSLRSPRVNGVDHFRQLGNVVDHIETVQVSRLDTLFSELTSHIDSPRVYLKMDTQGWDLEVFDGARQSLDLVVGLQSEMAIRLLYEGAPDFRAALVGYEEQGFAVSALYPVGRDEHLRLAEFDCVMVRDTGFPPAPAV